LGRKKSIRSIRDKELRTCNYNLDEKSEYTSSEVKFARQHVFPHFFFLLLLLLFYPNGLGSLVYELSELINSEMLIL
jgi:hypothetical protein